MWVKEAFYTKPHVFMPWYKLFKLYQRTKQLDQAKMMALEIQAMEIKVNSSTVMQIKNEINQYLLNQH